MTSSVVKTSAPQLEGSSWADNPLEHLVRLCVIFAQELWKEAPKGFFHWEQDDEHTEMTITDDAPISPDVAEKRPAIVAVRSQTGWAGIGMDQMQELKIRTGERVITDLLSGNVSLNCMSRVKTEAEYIAWVTANHFWILRYILLKNGFHDIGQRIQVMSPTPPGAIINGDTEAEIVSVPVVIPFHFQHTVRVSEEGLSVLKNMELSLQTRAWSVIKPTDQLMEGGWGTGLDQQGGTRAKHQNLRGNISPPSFRQRKLVPVTERPYPGGASSPQSVAVEIDEE